MDPKKPIPKPIKNHPIEINPELKETPIREEAVEAAQAKPEDAGKEITAELGNSNDSSSKVASWKKVQTAEGWKRGIKKEKAKKS